MSLKSWKVLDKNEEIMSENYYISDFETVSLPKELYDKLSEIAKEKFGYTGRGIVSDLVTEILESYVNKDRLRFVVYKHYIKDKPLEDNSAYYWWFKVIPLKVEDTDNDFVGTFSDLKSKEALLRVAKDGYGIEADEIEFIN